MGFPRSHPANDLHSLGIGALEEDAQSQDPLLAVHVAVVVGVESLEHAVQQDVVRHVEGVVQKFPVDEMTLGTSFTINIYSRNRL